MSQDNVEIVQRWVEAYNRREVERLLDVSHPEVEFRSVFAALESSGVFRGREGALEYFREIDSAYDDFVLVPLEFLDTAEQVLLAAEAKWRGKESGAVGSTPVWLAFWLRTGKVLHEQTFTDRTEAREAVGLSE